MLINEVEWWSFFAYDTVDRFHGGFINTLLQVSDI